MQINPTQPFIAGAHPDDRLSFRVARFPHDGQVSTRSSSPEQSRLPRELRESMNRAILSQHVPIVIIDDAVPEGGIDTFDALSLPRPIPSFDDMIIDYQHRDYYQLAIRVEHHKDELPPPPAALSGVDELLSRARSCVALTCWLRLLGGSGRVPDIFFQGRAGWYLDADYHRIEGPGLGGTFFSPHDHEDTTFLDLSVKLAMFTCGWMQCRNIEMVTRSHGLAPRTGRTHAPPLAWMTCRWLRVRRPDGSLVPVVEPQHRGGGNSKALHMVRGHFKNYGRDGGGRLFGRLTKDSVWCPPHMRGSSDRGVRYSNYELANQA